MRFLHISIAGRPYLCSEESVEKVILTLPKDLKPSPFGPPSIRYLFQYRDDVIPLFGRDEPLRAETIVLVVKNNTDMAGMIVDGVHGFVSTDTANESRSNTVTIAEKEYSIFDADALFLGREMI